MRELHAGAGGAWPPPDHRHSRRDEVLGRRNGRSASPVDQFMTDQWPARRPEWRLIAAVVVLAAVWLAMLIGGAGPLDRSIYEAVYAGHRPLLVTIARVFTEMGEPTVLIVAGFVVATGLWWVG